MVPAIRGKFLWCQRCRHLCQWVTTYFGKISASGSCLRLLPKPPDSENNQRNTSEHPNYDSGNCPTRDPVLGTFLHSHVGCIIWVASSVGGFSLCNDVLECGLHIRVGYTVSR